MTIKLLIARRGAPADERVFDSEIVTVGSDPSATLCLSATGIAPEQAIILNDENQLLFINRAEGTVLNGEVLAREARRMLSPGDTLQIGPYTIQVSPDGEERPAPRQVVEAGPAPSPPSTESTTHAEVAPTPAVEVARNDKSFAAILDSLRTEEDSFYFQIESAGDETRVAIEGAEMVIGWDDSGRRISCDASLIATPRAVVRKDWSGVVVLPLGERTVAVNDERAEGPCRLRNGDRLTLLPIASDVDQDDNYVIFHEPASLVVLDTLLPKELPPPVFPSPATITASTAEAPSGVVTASQGAQEKDLSGYFSPNHRYFGYFTLPEILIMIVGTLVAAGIIFLILENS
jgi:hypothetical protein